MAFSEKDLLRSKLETNSEAVVTEDGVASLIEKVQKLNKTENGGYTKRQLYDWEASLVKMISESNYNTTIFNRIQAEMDVQESLISQVHKLLNDLDVTVTIIQSNRNAYSAHEYTGIEFLLDDISELKDAISFHGITSDVVGNVENLLASAKQFTKKI